MQWASFSEPPIWGFFAEQGHLSSIKVPIKARFLDASVPIVSQKAPIVSREATPDLFKICSACK